MKKKKTKTKSQLSAASNLIALLVLLTLVLAYMLFLFPKFSLKIAQNEANVGVVALKIGILQPYASETQNLQDREKELLEQYEKDDSLYSPIKFSDIAYKAADDAGIVIKSLVIGEEVKLVVKQGYPAKQYAADITADYTTKEQVTGFMNKLEEKTGAGMYLENINFILPDLDTAGNVTVRVVMTTVNKEDGIIDANTPVQEGDSANANSSSNS